MFSQLIGILTELNPHEVTLAYELAVMPQPFPQESGLLAGLPVPKSRPSTSTPSRGITLPFPL
jgi:hypothetical protein